MAVKSNLGLFFFALGVLLVLVELLTLTTYVFPLGLGFIVSGLFYYFTGSFWGSLLLFVCFTGMGYWVSAKYSLKIKGQGSVLNELQKQTGVVINRLDQFTYEVRFPLGAAGEEVWNAYSREPLKYGDRVKVVALKGNKLVVEKVEDA
jgi:membrane protein implicated in regulation of membrane protease activity